MSRVLLVCRLASRDLRRRPVEALLLLLAIVGATTVLTLGLVLRGVTEGPYQSTREGTAGPDVVAQAVALLTAPDRAERRPPTGPIDRTGLEALADAPGVVGRTGPYPVVWAMLGARGYRLEAQVVGRDAAKAPIDQPKLTQGSWIRDGGVVFEAAFADAIGVGAGDRITLNGRSFQVVGVAVTAALSPYPQVSCLAFYCNPHAGLVWVTRADARSIAPNGRFSALILNLKLADPASARAFADKNDRSSVRAGMPPSRSDRLTPSLLAWQDVRDESADLVRNQRKTLLTGGWLLALLALASVAVLVGGRMANQIRRVGLLKAVGGTPSLVAAVLLAEYVVVALLATVAGLVLGRLAAPRLIDPSAGLVGRAGAPALTGSTVGLVTAVALGVAVAATVVPAVRAARTSTVLALADSARAPRRTTWPIALSARLPVPLLLGLRVAARRPRRVVLATASIAITVSGIVAALAARIDLAADRFDPSSPLDISKADRLNEVLLVITITLVALAAVNAIFITWATALDARHSSALARALGATPQQVSAGLSAAQVLPALIGAILGIPGGIALFAAVGDSTTVPPLWQLLAVVVGTVLVAAALTAVPARIGGRRPVAEILQSELA
jgi:ABC-type lipoprotein release transport system permease subunit